MKKKFSVLLTTALVVSMVFSYGGSVMASAEEGGIDTFNVGTSNALGNLLLFDNNGECYTAIYFVFDPLFDFDPETKDVYSDVLTDWGYSDDGYEFHMTLKDGITFSNGDTATGEDALFSISNYVERDASTAQYFEVYEFDDATIGDDGMTVSIPLSEPFSPRVWECQNSLPLLDKSWCEEVGWDSELWASGPVGSGPFAVTEYVTDSHVSLTKRDDYWGDAEYPYNDINIKFYSEVSTMYMDLETGALDVALDILENDYERAVNGESENVATQLISAGENRLLAFDTENEYLSQENVRLAIQYAVNWEDVATSAWGDMAPVATSILPSSSEYYEDVGAYEYDPDYARQLLEEAGYSDGDITLNFISSTEDDAVKMSTVLQYYLSEVGIELNYTSYDFTTALNAWLNGESDMIWRDSGSGSVIGEPYCSLKSSSINTSGNPYFKTYDEQYNEYLDAATYTVDPDVRRENFNALQEYVKEHALILGVLEENNAIAWRTDVIESVNVLGATDADLRNVVFVE